MVASGLFLFQLSLSASVPINEISAKLCRITRCSIAGLGGVQKGPPSKIVTFESRGGMKRKATNALRLTGHSRICERSEQF